MITYNQNFKNASNECNTHAPSFYSWFSHPTLKWSYSWNSTVLKSLVIHWFVTFERLCLRFIDILSGIIRPNFLRLYLCVLISSSCQRGQERLKVYFLFICPLFTSDKWCGVNCSSSRSNKVKTVYQSVLNRSRKTRLDKAVQNMNYLITCINCMFIKGSPNA